MLSFAPMNVDICSALISFSIVVNNFLISRMPLICINLACINRSNPIISPFVRKLLQYSDILGYIQVKLEQPLKVSSLLI